MDYHEYFEVVTEGDRCYLVEAVNAAHAAYRVEQQYQDRVVGVQRHVYHRIILVGDPNANAEAAEDSTETPVHPNEDGSQELARTTEVAEADGGQDACEEDVQG